MIVAGGVLDLGGHRLRDVRVAFEAYPETVGFGAFGCRIAFLPDGTLLRAVGGVRDLRQGADGLIQLRADIFTRGRRLRLEPA